MNQGIYTSDKKKYSYKDLRGMFGNCDEMQSIPRIYIIDACRDFDDTPMQRDGYGGGAKDFSTTLLQSEGNAVSAGKICFAITNILKKNFDNGTFQTLKKIRMNARNQILDATNNLQTIVVTEHDEDVDDVILLPNK